ncbi:MAG: helix-turn-helix domain-containing protein [Rhizobacter sp.]|nr:helix-turn-helix domain-containing protein [Ferruginibacter sp.]
MQHSYPLVSQTVQKPMQFSLGEKDQPVNNFEIQSFQWFRENQLYMTDKISKLNRYEFLWVRNGSGKLTVDMQHYEISDKTVCCLSPGQLRHIDPESFLDGYYVSLSADFFCILEAFTSFSLFSSIHAYHKKPLILEIDEELQIDLEEILAKMRKEFINASLQGAEILKGLFRIFLLYLSRNYIASEAQVVNRRDEELVRKFMLLLRSNFVTKKMVADYACELCVTPSYLNQVVKKVSGFTASHHIQQCVVMEAKRQAMHYGRSMKEIAYGLGFDDSAHFSKFFKKNSGQNFTSFKRAI